ncbi:MAG: DNA repair protein RecO [Gemmatimonadales bacterium]
MPLVSTPAIVLSAMRYGETSKIVRLATREHGVQSAIAKGALRPRSRFGAALQLLSGGQAQLLLSERRDLHTLTAFDVVTIPVGLAARVPCYATGMMLAELMLRLVPADAHPESFDLLESSLVTLQEVADADVPAAALRAGWRLIASLGFQPALERCARDGRPLAVDGEVGFSIADGGFLCPGCTRGTEVLALPRTAADTLRLLLDPVATLPALDQRHAAAHRRLLIRYLRHHVGEGSPLPALEFWGTHAWMAR